MDHDTIQALARSLAAHWTQTVPPWGSAARPVGQAVLATQLLGSVQVLPASAADAYAVQDALASMLGPVRAWKVGLSLQDGVSCAPIWARIVHGPEDGVAPMLASGHDGMEAEVAYRLARDLPPRDQPYAPTDLIDAVASTHVAIELLAPRVRQPDSAAEHWLVLADGLSSGGLVVGEGQPGCLVVDDTVRVVTVTAGGQEAWRAEIAASQPHGPLALLTWLANHLRVRGQGLCAGQVVTTGSWGGKLAIPAVDPVVASISGVGVAVLGAVGKPASAGAVA